MTSESVTTEAAGTTIVSTEGVDTTSVSTEAVDTTELATTVEATTVEVTTVLAKCPTPRGIANGFITSHGPYYATEIVT